MNFFPLPTAVKHLPPTWSHLETIKNDIQNLEHYLCENFTHVVRELTSNTQLMDSLRALVSGKGRTFPDFVLQGLCAKVMNMIVLANIMATVGSFYENFYEYRLTDLGIIRQCGDIADFCNMVKLF